MTPGISVVICCYNSGNKIIPTLEYLAKQEIPKSISWELILVDNCCTDDTISLAKQKWEDLPSSQKPPLVVIEEKKPGLSNARKTGIYSSQYDIICFCDDDNWLQKDYLRIAFENMASNENIGILGGQGIPISDHPIPEWFFPIQENYACGPLAGKSGDISEKTWIWGAGMVLRNSYMRKLYEAGFTQINSDRKGESLSSGGDSEICYWHLITGKKLWYNDKLIFHHYITPERLTKEFAERTRLEHEMSYNALHPYFPLVYPNPYRNRNRIALFAAAILSILKGKDGRFIFVLLRPWFNSRLNKRTLEIMESINKFSAL
jgi:glycosyltransferase involved in cell wall biosynthesis